ncbi:hypothetical protein FSARC_14295 [Fusarium sarcochroum]|uniref:F-box domain-containing protein n=1 Tax=Fusarium sarcochroum TaxID=1208366 RepID=A0A8H4SUF6_9HYPO|nr:hypothetical protein FSARC_14295 [Fusarium sarcochroum]
MTTSDLEKLPIGLITDIAKLLPFDDVKNLSCVSWVMRDVVLRLLFRTLSISCPLAPDRDLNGFIVKYKELISRLHLYIKLEPNPDFGSEYDSDEDEWPESPSIWGPSSTDTVKNIVRGQTLSHINTLSVQFDPDQFEEEGDWDDGNSVPDVYVYEFPEDWDKVRDREETFFWRAQYTEVWNEIAANPNINKLKILNLLPKNSSAWLTTEWKTFLGKMEDLDISVFGAGNGILEAHKMPGFYGFAATLPEVMMRHATKVTRLRLVAHKQGLLGSTSDMHQVPLPLEKRNLPSLRFLQLENIMLGHESLDFLKHHADTLQELQLHSCMCHGDDVDPSWSDLWKLIREVTTTVTEVTYVQDKTPPITEHEKFDSIPTSEDSDAEKKIRKLLAEDKSLVLWRYVYVDDKYGFVSEYREENIEHFERGNDQLEYNKLMEELTERRKKGL